MKQKFLNLLNREVAGIVHFNDVFPERPTDIDAELTTIVRNLGNFSDLFFPIGQNPKLADYGLDLLNDLISEQNRILSQIKSLTGKNITNSFTSKAVLAIANKADRTAKTTQNGKNGEDFHLAITDNNLEIFTCPLDRLQILETRNKILALYRIPNAKIPIIDGNNEQFRSSIIATTRYFPEILEPIFEYENVEKLKQAKKNGTHPNIIPTQKNNTQFAFADKFGNVRILVKDNLKFTKNIKNKKFGDMLNLQIGNSQEIEVSFVRSLKEIPTGKLGIYQNVADVDNSGACYWEIIKKSENCNFECKSAFSILSSLNENFREEEIFVR